MDLLTVDEVAKILRAHTNTVYKLCRKGELPATKVGKEWRISQEKLAEFMHASTVSGIESNETATAPSAEFRPGHTLVLMAEPDDVWNFEARFFSENANRGYLLFKACWWQKPDEVRKVYAAKGLPVAQFEASGEMVLADLASICATSGPVAAADAWRAASHLALDRGFKGMIGCGAPHLDECCTRKDLLVFEEALDGFLDGLPVEGVCAYHVGDRASSDWSALIRLISVHGKVRFLSREMSVTAQVL